MMDIQLNFVEKGQGEPLILLHGNGEDSTYFVNQIENFSKYRRVIAVDTRGHGKSPKGTKPFTLVRFAEDLEAFMEVQGIEKANILGFSDGGNIALLFALKNPKRVGKLILNAANLFPMGMKFFVWLEVAVSYLLFSLFNKPQKEFYALMLKEPHIDPSALNDLNMPTLVIAGSRDMIRNSHTKLIHSRIPNSQLVIIEGDHFIAAKESKNFNEAVETFLKQT